MKRLSNWGAGKLGLSILDVLCHSAGACTTIVTDLQPYRLDVIKKLGADYAINITQGDPVEAVREITQGQGVDCVIEEIGHYHEIDGQEPRLSQAVTMIRNGGRIVTCGLGEQTTAVHFKTLVIKEASIISSRVTLGEFRHAIRLMSKGLLHPDLLITHQMPMTEVMAAFTKVDEDDPSTIKIVLDVQDV